MPAYSFKANFHNQSTSLTLRRVDLNACEGGYTDGWGTPPVTIPPGQTISFQAESTAMLHGCRGYVKYEVGYLFEQTTFEPRGFLCFFWDVPVIGNTSYKLMKAHQAITCDCDGAMSTEDDAFGGSQSLNFDINAADTDGVPNDGHGHNQLDLYFVGTASPGLPSTQPFQYSPFSKPTAGDWEGHWSTSGVDLVITRLSGDTASIEVRDPAAPDPLNFTVTVDLSQPSGIEVTKEPIVNVGGGVRSVFPPDPVSHPKPASGTVVASTALHSPPTIPLVVQDVLHLRDGVVLTLMKVTDSTGASRGDSIRYQIVPVSGKTIRELEIARYTAPPR